MLYSLIIVFLVLLFTAFEQILFVKVLESAKMTEKVIDMPKIGVVKAKRTLELTDDEKKAIQILDNINNYNGTSFGQTKVEVK